MGGFEVLEGGVGGGTAGFGGICMRGTLQKASPRYRDLGGLPGICSFWGKFPCVGSKKTIWLRLEPECVHSSGAG